MYYLCAVDRVPRDFRNVEYYDALGVPPEAGWVLLLRVEKIALFQ